jgi:hypothetical protein
MTNDQEPFIDFDNEPVMDVVFAAGLKARQERLEREKQPISPTPRGPGARGRLS